MADAETVVIDNGSGLIKAGLSADSEPRTVFPTSLDKRYEHETSIYTILMLYDFL